MTAKALIFDSGVGGFSVFQHIRQAVPGLASCYLMDNQLFPYGIQTDGVLRERIVNLCVHACAHTDIDVVVIACNTASTLALPALREALDIPVIGVVPAIKTAAQQSKTQHIALLATPATIDRPYIDQLISRYAQHCTVERLGSSALVKLAEDYWFLNHLDAQHLNTILDPLLKNSDIDQLVLGCTHFPLLSDYIAKRYPQVTMVDSGLAIARRICVVLQELNYSIPELQSPNNNHLLFTTTDIHDKKRFLSACQQIAPYQSFNII